MQVAPDLWLDAPARSQGGFINHSCDPNCGIKERTKIVAMKPIRKGEEITIDYSTTVEEKKWNMKCLCGSKFCRKVIKPYRLLPKKLQQKYKGYEADFLRR